MDRVTRRNFFCLLSGWLVAMVSFGGSLLAGLRFLFPNVLYEPSSKFKIGYPSDYVEGSVTFIEEIRAFILRKDNKVSALSAICTHLGCTVNRIQATDSYYCPCHGSQFDKEGNVLSGPAPRALAWYAVTLAKDGRLVIDTKKTVPSNKGLRLGG